MLMLVCLILANKLLSLNTFTVLHLSRRIQLLGILLGPVVRVCAVSPPSLFAEEVVLRKFALLRLSVSAVTAVASLTVLLEVEAEPVSESLWPEWIVLFGSDVVELCWERVGELIGMDGGPAGGGSGTQSSSESSPVRS